MASKIPICFTWTGTKERYAPHSPLSIGHIDLLIQDAVSSPMSLLVSVVIPDGSSEMIPRPFICEKRLKALGNSLIQTTKLDRLELTAQQIRHLASRAVFFRPLQKTIFHQELRIESSWKTLIEMPKKLSQNHLYCLNVTASEDLSLQMELVDKSRSPIIPEILIQTWQEQLLAVMRKSVLPGMISVARKFSQTILLRCIKVTLFLDKDPDPKHGIEMAEKLIQKEIDTLAPENLQELMLLIYTIKDRLPLSFEETDWELTSCMNDLSQGFVRLIGTERLVRLARSYLTDFVQDRPIPPCVQVLINFFAKNFLKTFVE